MKTKIEVRYSSQQAKEMIHDKVPAKDYQYLDIVEDSSVHANHLVVIDSLSKKKTVIDITQGVER